MIGLSQNAQDVAAFIGAYQAEHCTSPTFAEMAVAIGFQAKSKASIYNIMRQLERAGIVKLSRDSAGRVRRRGIQLTDNPMCPCCGKPNSPVLKAAESTGGQVAPQPRPAGGPISQHQVS